MIKLRTGAILLMGVALMAGLSIFRSRLPLYPKASMAVNYSLGRVQGCSFQAALLVPQNTDQQLALTNQILARSHVVAKDPAGYEQWATPDGSYWVPDVTSKIGLPYLLAMMQRRVYTARLPIQAGDVVLDGGAHVGVFTREALKAGASLVVAIEPVKENIACLRRNLAAEIADGRVILYEGGLWDSDGTVPLQFDPNDSLVHSMVLTFGKPAQMRTVPVTTVDDLVKKLVLEKVSFIKLNIEGAEQRALRGARSTLSMYRPRIAVAPYHLDDDQIRIPVIVREGWTQYKMTTGDCVRLHDRLRPEVLYFR